MPNKFVFPGGGIDRSDSRIQPVSGLRPEVAAKLASFSQGARPQTLAMAAIRETFEETGLRVGRISARGIRTRSRSWAAYSAPGVAPSLDILDLVARAITPPGESRRFDARFFMTSADHLFGDPDEALRGSGELLDLQWVELERATELDLPGITQLVLGEIAMRLSLSVAERSRVPVPFIRFRNGKPAYGSL